VHCIPSNTWFFGPNNDSVPKPTHMRFNHLRSAHGNHQHTACCFVCSNWLRLSYACDVVYVCVNTVTTESETLQYTPFCLATKPQPHFNRDVINFSVIGLTIQSIIPSLFHSWLKNLACITKPFHYRQLVSLGRSSHTKSKNYEQNSNEIF